MCIRQLLYMLGQTPHHRNTNKDANTACKAAKPSGVRSRGTGAMVGWLPARKKN